MSDNVHIKTWIALFRGINVGGKNSLPMAELRAVLESLKLSNIRTYIQSGNVVFDAALKQAGSLGAKIGTRVEEQHGFRPEVLVFSRDELQAAVEANPFAEALSDPRALHFFFLARPPRQANIAALDHIKAASEAYKLTDRVLYLHAPEGIGRSKLAANAEKHLGVVTTARNYRTVEKLLALATPAS